VLEDFEAFNYEASCVFVPHHEGKGKVPQNLDLALSEQF
jgi:hypothetical protein